MNKPNKTMTKETVSLAEFTKVRNLAGYKLVNYNQANSDNLQLAFMDFPTDTLKIKDVKESAFTLIKYSNNKNGIKSVRRELVDFNLNDFNDIKVKLPTQLHQLVNQIEVLVNLLVNDTEEIDKLYKNFENIQNEFNIHLNNVYQALLPELAKGYYLEIDEANENNLFGDLKLVQYDFDFKKIIGVFHGFTNFKAHLVENDNDEALLDKLNDLVTRI